MDRAGGLISLSARLAAAESLLDGGDGVVDIGTDHAYLPAYLVQSGKCKTVLACDIGEKPLLNAKKTILRYDLSDRIELRESDGFQNVRPEELREASVCGMGGTLIAEILSAAPWIRRPGTHLVLQPMTHAEDVRRWLCANGFRIEAERCVCEGKRTYLFLSARYTGQPDTSEPGYHYFGSLIGGDAPSRSMARKQYNRIALRVSFLNDAGEGAAEADVLRRAIEYYERKMHEATGTV